MEQERLDRKGDERMNTIWKEPASHQYHLILNYPVDMKLTLLQWFDVSGNRIKEYDVALASREMATENRIHHIYDNNNGLIHFTARWLNLFHIIYPVEFTRLDERIRFNLEANRRR